MKLCRRAGELPAGGTDGLVVDFAATENNGDFLMLLPPFPCSPPLFPSDCQTPKTLFSKQNDVTSSGMVKW